MTTAGDCDKIALNDTYFVNALRMKMNRDRATVEGRLYVPCPPW